MGRHEVNERLEFLGDAVLDFVIAEYFYHLFPGMVEGQLTKLRSVIVSGTSLVGAAKRIDLGEFLLLSDNEDKAGGRLRSSILEDAFEALIGAIYLDGGVKPARVFVETNVLDNWRDIVKKDEYVNYKSLVLEHAQANSWDSPEYRLVEESGPDHSKLFIVEIILNGEAYGRGEGTSKKAAEQKAASAAAAKLGLLSTDDFDLSPNND
ncbi:MAG: ribonuclease III [bacterium]|nr:ribonuclease III [bacterium]